MRIEGTGSVGKANKSDKKKKAGEADGSFSKMLDGAEGEQATSEAATIQTTAPLDALLAIQEAENKAELAKKALDWGEDALNDLADLRMQLLEGNIDPQKATQISERVKAHTESTQDPELLALLREIETRAAVEAAKLDSSV